MSYDEVYIDNPREQRMAALVPLYAAEAHIDALLAEVGYYEQVVLNMLADAPDAGEA